MRDAGQLQELTQMPRTPGHTHHKAATRELKELWTKIANETLDRTGDEGRAIHESQRRDHAAGGSPRLAVGYLPGG
jgi:hypothetical protein